MADVMSESWLAFVRTGDPNNAAVPEWRPYDLERRTVMHLDVPPVAVDDPFPEERLAMARYETQQARGGVLHRSPPTVEADERVLDDVLGGLRRSGQEEREPHHRAELDAVAVLVRQGRRRGRRVRDDDRRRAIRRRVERLSYHQRFPHAL